MASIDVGNLNVSQVTDNYGALGGSNFAAPARNGRNTRLPSFALRKESNMGEMRQNALLNITTLYNEM